MSPTALGALLALSAAVALNASFLLQHAGSVSAPAIDPRRPLATMASLLRSPAWAIGAVAGLVGWGLHIAAMREAPLSLVQAFVAGGLALAAPMAAIGLRHRLQRSEVQAVVAMAAALALLALGLPGGGRHAAFAAPALGVAVLVLGAGAAALAWRAHGARRPLALGLAGGLLYAAADLSLKAVTGLHGATAIVTSPWLLTGIVTTMGAFFAFQRGLQAGRPLAVIAVMTAATNVASIAGAFAVFGDPLGRTPLLQGVHVLAFALVVAAAWRLAPAQARLAETATA